LETPKNFRVVFRFFRQLVSEEIFFSRRKKRNHDAEIESGRTRQERNNPEAIQAPLERKKQDEQAYVEM